MNKLIYTIILAMLGHLSMAQNTYLVEHFDYPAGDSLQNLGWYSHSAPTNNPIKVHTRGLSWTQTPYIGSGVGNAAIVNNNGSDENKPLSSWINSGSAYASFLLRLEGPVSAASPNNRGYFFHLGEYQDTANPNFNSLNTGFRARTHIAAGSTSANYRLGLTFNANTVEANDFTGDLDTGKTYLVVVKYTFVPGDRNDHVSLFLFEDGDDISVEPSAPTIGPVFATLIGNPPAPASDFSFMQCVVLRQYNLNPNIVVDGIVVKDGWDLLAPDELVGPSLISPPNNTSLTVEGDAETEIDITWTAIQDAPESPVYLWEVTALASPDFDDPTLSLPSNNSGADNSLTLTLEAIDGVLGALGLEVGDEIELLWRVRAIVGMDEVVSVDTFAITLTRGYIFDDFEDFSLLSPADGTRVELKGDLSQEVVISWQPTTAGPFPVTYQWVVDAEGGDFSNPPLMLPSDNMGMDNSLTLTLEDLDNAIASIGVVKGDSISLIWTVMASANDEMTSAAEVWSVKLVRDESVSVNAVKYNSLNIYPNPANNMVSIDFSQTLSSNAKIFITNVLGQETELKNVSRTANGIQFSVNELNNGVYTVRVEDNGIVSTGTVMVQK